MRLGIDLGGNKIEALVFGGVGMPGAPSPAAGLVENANSTWLSGQRLDRDHTAAPP